jgi:hypothetical protein
MDNYLGLNSFQTVYQFLLIKLSIYFIDETVNPFKLHDIVYTKRT